jgi:hypothetical protein
MDNTLFDEHIRKNDLGAIDEDIVAINRDGEVAIGDSRQLGAVYEVGRVGNNIRHDVVSKNARKLGHGHVCEGGADGLEGLVVGDKGGQIGGERSTGQAGVGNSAQSGGLVEGIEGGRDVLWNSQKVVNDVDDTTGKVDILQVC